MNRWQRTVCAVAALIIGVVFLWFAGQPSAAWHQLVGIVGAVAGVATCIWFAMGFGDAE
jgi:hypothetical protein